MIARRFPGRYYGLLILGLTGLTMRVGAQDRPDSMRIRQRMNENGVTTRDLDQLHAKLAIVTPFLQRAWSFSMFPDIFSAVKMPTFRAYALPFHDPLCDDIAVNNAMYCRSGNVVFFDEIMLAGEMRRIGAGLGTDGDYAAIVILEHELGHAIGDVRMGAKTSNWRSEAIADCVAGAITWLAEQNGHLDPLDVEEGRRELRSGGTPNPKGQGDALTTIRIFGGNWDNHGSAESRARSFEIGYSGNFEACRDVQP